MSSPPRCTAMIAALYFSRNPTSNAVCPISDDVQRLADAERGILRREDSLDRHRALLRADPNLGVARRRRVRGHRAANGALLERGTLDAARRVVGVGKPPRASSTVLRPSSRASDFIRAPPAGAVLPAAVAEPAAVGREVPAAVRRARPGVGRGRVAGSVFELKRLLQHRLVIARVRHCSGCRVLGVPGRVRVRGLEGLDRGQPHALVVDADAVAVARALLPAAAAAVHHPRVLHLVRQRQQPKLHAHKLRRDRAQQHVSALHGHEVQPVQPSQRGDGLIDDRGPGGDHRADRERVEFRVVVAVAVAVAFLPRSAPALEEERRGDENVRHAGHRDGNAVDAQREEAHRLFLRVPVAHHPLHDEVRGRAYQRARPAEDGREGQRDEELRLVHPDLVRPLL
eukprot:31036-Pelagococcus_subviridis.AAC.9